MSIQSLILYVLKLALGAAAFVAGTMAGGMLVTALGLTPPQLPQGLSGDSAVAGLLLTSPLIALAVALLARGLAGGFVPRALSLAFFTWIVYTVNTALETTLIMPGAAGLYTVIVFLPAALGVGALVAWLFPPAQQGESFAAVCRAFCVQRSAGAWAWRLAVAAVVFMPIYIVFGNLVMLVVAPYYRDGVAGLNAPTWEQLLPVLFTRSVLFLLASLPIIAAWQMGRHVGLPLRLGIAMFLLVGLVGLLGADWLPLVMRVSHSLEILADSLVYAWALAWLLSPAMVHAAPRTDSKENPVGPPQTIGMG